MRKQIFFIFLTWCIALLTFSSEGYCGEFYKSVDKNGNVYITNMPTDTSRSYTWVPIYKDQTPRETNTAKTAHEQGIDVLNKNVVPESQYSTGRNVGSIPSAQHPNVVSPSTQYPDTAYPSNIKRASNDNHRNDHVKTNNDAVKYNELNQKVQSLNNQNSVLENRVQADEKRIQDIERVNAQRKKEADAVRINEIRERRKDFERQVHTGRPYIDQPGYRLPERANNRVEQQFPQPQKNFWDNPAPQSSWEPAGRSPRPQVSSQPAQHNRRK